MEDREETTTRESQEPQLPKCPGEYGNWEFRGVSDSSYAGTGLGIQHYYLLVGGGGCW